jgi:hypothetical protein
MNTKSKLATALAAISAATTFAAASPVSAHETGLHDNCTEFNKRYPHGVGTRGAVDKSKGAKVTTFLRSNKVYWTAENHNYDLDRDNDHIACEKQ